MIYSPVIPASAVSHHHTNHYGDIEKINDIEYSGSYLKCIQQQDNSLICGEYYKPSQPMEKQDVIAISIITVVTILLFASFIYWIACTITDNSMISSYYLKIKDETKNKEIK